MVRQVAEAPVLTRRERARQATIAEIKSVGRELLAGEGESGVTIRAIAREMGMTAPAVYRYFTSHELLIRALRADVFAEAARAVLTGADDGAARDDALGRLLAAGRALRRWALSHRHEFSFVLGRSPVSPDDACDDEAQDAGWVFGSAFAGLLFELWLTRPFPVPAESELAPELVEQLNGLRISRQLDLPVGAIAVMLSGWVRLHGVICLDVLGHLAFVLPDAEAFFEHELHRLCTELGMADGYRPPR
ncbi:TetR/AcrR family transcriptional regulator [Streptomyces kaniharaensis]|uniref:TetR/AcrR family transcriptional regulator n=1 Tax=Streptomyces kaniharaensis TaxID=212423 RepID=A0A6N7KVR5_9ACTN|nr:TetR/AcrR family transcriptional regulator [Streptomyces kaniharaensis]MQS15551.1 TetR/AcrR family transcriptional regulator [Streptomyces kaniharaensis]